MELFLIDPPRLILIFLFTSIFFSCIELFFRYCITEMNRDANGVNNISFYSDSVNKRPNSTLHFRFYIKNAHLWVGADCKLNNMGYFSTYDYSYEKLPNEFRILTLGGEQTASSVVNKSWPNILNEILNQKNMTKKITVINLAWPDAGPEHYLKTWQEEGIKFQPDLVLINLVETDYIRYLDGSKLAYKNTEIGQHTSLLVAVDKFKDKLIYMAGNTLKPRKKLIMADADVIVSRPFGMFAPYEYMTDMERIKKLQKNIFKDFIKGGLPDFGGLSKVFFSLKFWKTLLPILVKSKGNIKNFAATLGTVHFSDYMGLTNRNYTVLSTPSKMEIYGDKIIKLLYETVPNVLFIHSFNGAELETNTEYTYSNQVMKHNPDIQIIDMRQRLAKNCDKGEMIKKCFMVPHMGEKHSQEGHKMYAELVADLILEKYPELQKISP